jgi:hypothetical protein
VQEGDGVSVEGGGGLGVVEGGVGVLDDEVLRVGGAEAPEVDEERVPGLTVLVPVPEGFEGEEGGAPDEGSNQIRVRVQHVEGSAHVLPREEVAQDAQGVVVGGRALMERADFSRYRATLLSEHVVVVFTRGRGQVVRVPAAGVGELL